MEKSIGELQLIIAGYIDQLNALSEDEWSLKPNPAKWSRKEVLGHLIDSAQNNIRRFIVAQYEDNPKIVYAQDYWVALANYQNYTTNDLVTLWVLLNKHICVVLKTMSEEVQQRTADTGDTRSIKWLADDYNKHMLHHLHHLLHLEPVAYP